MPTASESEFLHSLLRNWPGLFAAATLVDRHQGFSGALVCRISVSGQEFAIRGWPTESLPRKRLAGLHRFLRDLHQQGLVQISVPIATTNGPTAVDAAGRWWQLEPWMPGRASFAEAPTSEKLTSVMQLLARLHHLAARYVPDDESAMWFAVQAAAPSPGVIERLQLIGRWKDTDPHVLRRLMQKSFLPEPILSRLEEILSRFYRHVEHIERELNELLAVSFRLQPCVRDLWHDHVLFCGKEVTGLIDFGACRSENPMIDLSRLLGSFFPDAPARWQEALAVYETLRPLLPEERKLLQAFDRSQRLLAGMTWLQRLILERDIPFGTDRIEQRLEGILAGLRPLDHSLS